MSTRLQTIILFASPVLLLTLTAGGSWYIYTQNIHYAGIQKKTDAQIQLLASTTASISQSIKLIQENLSSNKNLSESLKMTLTAEQEKAASFQKELERVTGTVGTLDKLSKTDKELLQKYSKVYFLNEHYVPASLSDIEKKYLYTESQDIKLHSDVLPHLAKLIDDAALASTTLYVRSGYRSFYDQAHLKSEYSVTYGAGTANQFSADQGYSEHQLGTTVDFTTVGINGGLVGFDKTPAFKWLQENARLYGFILSYPKSNSYYIYEPWHWRYVGVALATKLHVDNVNFYDTDQRVIDEYLVSIFDQN